MSQFTSEDLKTLEQHVMKYLSTKRGGKHYETFELMYNMIESHKHMRRVLTQLSQEIYRSSS